MIGATWKHVISVGDDGFLVLHDLGSFNPIRRVDVVKWAVYAGTFFVL